MAEWLRERSIDQIDPDDFPVELKDRLAGSHLKKRVIHVACTVPEKSFDYIMAAKKCLGTPGNDRVILHMSGDPYPLVSYMLGSLIDMDLGTAGIMIGDDGQELLYPGAIFPRVSPSPNVCRKDEAETTIIHNCSNVLGLGAVNLTPEEAVEAIRSWAASEFDPFGAEGGVRLRRYLQAVKIGQCESKAGDPAARMAPAAGGKRLLFYADHRGHDTKQYLMEMFRDCAYELIDLGTYSKERCDYPVFAARAAEALASNPADGTFAIGICGSGIGAAAAAKAYNVRGARGLSEQDAVKARRRYNANLLTLPAGDGSSGCMGRAVRMIGQFLATRFDPDAAPYYDLMLRKGTDALVATRSLYQP